MKVWLRLVGCLAVFVILYSVLLIAKVGQLTKTIDEATPVEKVEEEAQKFSEPEIEDTVEAVKGLIKRTIGEEHLVYFVLELIDLNEKDVFVLEANPALPIRLKGTSGVALASAFNWYLKYYCENSISWGWDGSGNNLVLPSPLPPVTKTVRMSSPVQYRYYMNVCTVSYSMAWWDWERWEKEIDWMAMNGINLPLSFTGQEYIWAKVWSKFGLTEEQMLEDFGGPAFLAWARMGNIRGWGGPLTKNWRKQQFEMQKKILARQRSLGMKAVLPAFAGHIPKGIADLYPNAMISRSARWNYFQEPYCCNYLLSPTDPLFGEIASTVVRIQMEEYGMTDHIYNGDTFNEMDPSSDDPAYLSNVSFAVYEGMARADPEAIWMMQGWLFHFSYWQNRKRVYDYLSGVPKENLILLDLNSEQSPLWEMFVKDDRNFIWCMLHNYGGQRSLYGDLPSIGSRPVHENTAAKGRMIGTGLTMEAIDQNYVVYELMNEMGWRNQVVDVNNWVQLYAKRRYGGYSPHMAEAWKTLLASIYTENQWSWVSISLIVRFPHLEMHLNREYNTTGLTQAWRNYILSAKEYQETNAPWEYDLVDITRQVLNNLFADLFSGLYAVYRRCWTSEHLEPCYSEMKDIQNAMDEIIVDLDQILGTNVNFLVGKWIETARAWGSTDEEKDLLEMNARNQITSWGPNGEINDYAAKDWNGLMSDYYRVRWRYFFTILNDSIRKKEAVNWRGYQKDALELGKKWFKAKNKFASQPAGNPLQLAVQYQEKYAPDLSSVLLRYHRRANTNLPTATTLQITWTRDIGQLSYLCDINPSCKGFTSEGVLSGSDQSESKTNIVAFLKKQ